MRKAVAKIAALGFLVATSGAHAQGSDIWEQQFLQCMQDCQDFQPNAQAVAQCENWCYIYYNYQ